MAEQRNYTNLFEIYKDTEMYLILRNKGSLNLSHIRPIAQNRWPWMVSNWPTLKQLFTTFVNGNQSQSAALEDLQREVSSYKLGNTTINPLQSLDKTITFSPFLELIELTSIKLTPEEIILRDKEIERVGQLEVETFQQMLTFIRKNTAIEAATIGLGDEDAARLLGLQVAPKRRTATIQDLDRINETNKLYKIIEGIVYDLNQTRKRPPNLLQIANQNISADSPVAIQDTYLSYVPVPFEISLESMAQKYLGDKRRWYELATVNQLHPPFIDEVGTKLPLLAPAAVNNLIISSSLKDSVFVGTKISIGSYRYREETRVVERAIINENNTMVLFLGGTQDLNKFLSSEGAFVRIYAPNTTRKGNYVLIPSTAPGVTQRAVATPNNASLRQLEQAFLNFGIDIARDRRTNDFIIDANGNFKFAAGFPAIRQAVLYALKTTQGELPWHPNYGVNINIGDRFFGSLNEAVVFGELLRDTLLRDPRFSDVLINKVGTTGTGISLGLLVSIQGIDQPLPLAFVS